MTQVYLLDTNAVSDVMNAHSTVVRQTLMREAHSAVIAISAITAAEVRFGIRKRSSTRLQAAFDEFCLAAQILPWDDAAATTYADLRHSLTRQGMTLDAMDLLIAAHAIAANAVLVTRDQAFQHVKDRVKIVNWATDLKQG